MASSTLLTVAYIDGTGRVRRAAEDAAEAVDCEALWAFRGGGGLGVATALTVELIAPQQLWAGYRLWSIDTLDAVTAARAEAMTHVGNALSTTLSVLHTPPGAPTFPPALRGLPIVHLAYASPHGPDTATPLLTALHAAPPPALDTSWAPATAARLAQIHLDPPNPVPALGLGRWLGPHTPAIATEVLRTAAAADLPLAIVELRNLDNTAPARDGALTAVPGPFLLHAVGTAGDTAARARTEAGLTAVCATARPVDIGKSAAPFADGRAADPNGLDHADLQRLARVNAALDPDGYLSPSRTLAAIDSPTSRMTLTERFDHPKGDRHD